MVDGRISTQQSAFAFALGYALQIVDDLQDSVEDGKDGQDTLLTVVDTGNIHDIAYAESTAKRLATFLDFVCNNAGEGSSGEINGVATATTTGASSGDEDCGGEGGVGVPAGVDELRPLILSMTWNMVLKAVARNPTIFGPEFVKEWGTLGPLPPEKMEHLQSLKALHRLALADLI
jgi:hypothetical protein